MQKFCQKGQPNFTDYGHFRIANFSSTEGQIFSLWAAALLYLFSGCTLYNHQLAIWSHLAVSQGAPGVWWAASEFRNRLFHYNHPWQCFHCNHWLCFDQNYYSDVFLLQPSSLVLQLKQDAAHFSCQYLAEPLKNLLPFSDGQDTMTKKQKIGEG